MGWTERSCLYRKFWMLFLVAALGNQAAGAAEPTETVEGDQQRHYYFDAAGKEMPYRLYVPRSYDPARPTALIVALHGYGGDQDYFFNSVEDLPALIEDHGFIFVAPMGYSISGWYGAPLHIPGDIPRSPDADGNPRPKPADLMRPAREQLRDRRLSELDVLNVLELVRGQYNIDAERIYLMGHSMGGMGTYFLGQKHADTWAAIAPMSSTMSSDYVDYHLDRLLQVPVFISVGETETDTVANAEAQLQQMRELGMTAELLVVPGGTHGSMIAPTVPEIFRFFARYAKGGRAL